MTDQVRVRALTNHTETADPEIDVRLAGEVYHTTLGLARRRVRADLVELAPNVSPDDQSESEEDVQESGEADEESESQPEVAQDPHQTDEES